MTSGIFILVSAFTVAVLGFFAGNTAEPGKAVFLGLSRLGTAMLFVSVIGFVIGIWKETGNAREGKAAKEEAELLRNQLEQNGDDLKLIKATLDGLAKQSGITPDFASDLMLLSDRVSAVATW